MKTFISQKHSLGHLKEVPFYKISEDCMIMPPSQQFGEFKSQNHVFYFSLTETPDIGEFYVPFGDSLTFFVCPPNTTLCLVQE